MYISGMPATVEHSMRVSLPPPQNDESSDSDIDSWSPSPVVGLSRLTQVDQPEVQVPALTW